MALRLPPEYDAPHRHVGADLKNVPDADLLAEIWRRREARDNFRLPTQRPIREYVRDRIMTTATSECFAAGEPKVDTAPQAPAPNQPKAGPTGPKVGSPAKSIARVDAERAAGEAVARIRRSPFNRGLDIPFGGHWI